MFAEITNLTNHANPCCLSYEAHVLGDGSAVLGAEVQNGLPFIANFGVLWEF